MQTIISAGFQHEEIISKNLSVSALSLVLMACSSKTEKAPKFLQSNDIESSDWQVFEGDRRTYERVAKIVDLYANRIFNGNARGMAIIVIDNNQALSRYYGETAPGNGKTRSKLIRIASLPN